MGNMIQRARWLRRHATQQEELLWGFLRNRKTGHKIRRQHPMGHAILDFYCPAARVAIEIDGSHHDDIADSARDALLFIDILRFTNQEVDDNIFDVVERIRRALDAKMARNNPPQRSSSPSPQCGHSPELRHPGERGSGVRMDGPIEPGTTA